MSSDERREELLAALRKLEEVVRQVRANPKGDDECWEAIDPDSIKDAVCTRIDGMGGKEWIRESWLCLLSDPDDVLHARGLAIQSGWKPPTVHTFEYEGSVVYFDYTRFENVPVKSKRPPLKKVYDICRHCRGHNDAKCRECVVQHLG